MNFVLGIIVKTDSTIIIKDDDGCDIKLTLLKNPIDLSDLKCNDEENNERTYVRKASKKLPTIAKSETNQIIANKIYGTLLKEPIPLDILKKNKSNKTIINVKLDTLNNAYCIKSKKRISPRNCQLAKQNALTIFEYSYVYPFIHALNKYKCFICAKVFLEANPLREHTIQDHDVKEIKQQLFNRVRDKNIKVDVTLSQCRICLLVCDDIKSLKLHLKEHGKIIVPDLQDNIIPFKLGDSNFECQICRESFLKLRLLIIHMSKHFNNYSCETCGATFISLHLLKRHLQTHKVGNFPCEKCNKVFTNSAKRTLHNRGVHLKQFSRTCPICPERFNSNYQRTKHLRIVHNHNTATFRCETCGREYDLKYQLLVHIRSVHMQERNQECEICHARFFSKYCLSRHMVVHTGEKSFKCDICGKSYARFKNLNDHLKSHQVGHVCTICEFNCGDQASLIVHINRHHHLE